VVQNFCKALKIGFIFFNLSSLEKSCSRFERSTAFFKATQIKRVESDLQSHTNVSFVVTKNCRILEIRLYSFVNERPRHAHFLRLEKGADTRPKLKNTGILKSKLKLESNFSEILPANYKFISGSIPT